ncbi:MAG: formylmethanofuran dehydrogenase subunit C [Methanosarcinales archaeon]|nr:formylmethanofuran dehydrogenase subunit C [Methanosarcinales archaeon]
MNEITLTPIKEKQNTISVEAETITPDNFAGKSIKDIESIILYHGNRAIPIKDYFTVEGTPSDDASEIKIIIDGSVPRLKRVGEKMTTGEILIKGDIDMHVGAEMIGGLITIEGNADNYAGREMHGGTIHIKGNSLHYLGGSSRGTQKGMYGGNIIIDGSCGDHVGAYMQGGVVEIAGNVGQSAGMHMKNGTIIIGGNSFSRIGAEMANGKIFVKGTVHLTTASLGYGSECGVVKDPEVEGRVVEGEFYELRGDLGFEPKCGIGRIYAETKYNEHILPGDPVSIPRRGSMPPGRDMLNYVKMYHSEIKGEKYV